MSERKKKRRTRKKTRKHSGRLLLICLPILLVLLIILLLLSLFVFPIKEIQVTSLRKSQSGVLRLLRYEEDAVFQLETELTVTNSLASRTLTFTSDQPEIAAVDADGVITGLAPGEALITVKSKGNPFVKTTVPVTIVQIALDMGISMPEDLPSNEFFHLLHRDDKVSLVPKPYPENALVEGLSFESANPDVVSVSSNGELLVKDVGITSITASWTPSFPKNEEDAYQREIGSFLVSVCPSKDHETLAEHEIQWYDESCLIAHALGNIGEHTYTNSKEALEESISEGFKVMEVDLNMTLDQEVVCRHTWFSDTFEVSYDGSIPDLATFEKEKYFGTLTPLTGRELLKIWAEYPELYFVTDVKQDENTNIYEVLTGLVALAREMDCEYLLDHMIVQLYNIEEYDRINAIYPVKHWIFTTYQLPDYPNAAEDAAAFAAEHDFDVLTSPAWCMGTDYFPELAKKHGLNLFIHVIDDAELIEKQSQRGIYGYYTAFLAPNELK